MLGRVVFYLSAIESIVDWLESHENFSALHLDFTRSTTTLRFQEWVALETSWSTGDVVLDYIRTAAKIDPKNIDPLGILPTI